MQGFVRISDDHFAGAGFADGKGFVAGTFEATDDIAAGDDADEVAVFVTEQSALPGANQRIAAGDPRGEARQRRVRRDERDVRNP